MNKAHHKEFEEALIVAFRALKIVMKENPTDIKQGA